MSITISYTGCLENSAQNRVLIDEIIDICRSMDWTYTIESRVVKNAEIHGLQVYVQPQSEALSLLFNTSGCLVDPNTGLVEIPVKMNTQFATPDVHMTLINLLVYIGKKYFKDFEIYDETGFAHSSDPQDVEIHFAQANYSIARVKQILAKRADQLLTNQMNYITTHKIEKMLQQRLQSVLIHQITVKSKL